MSGRRTSGRPSRSVRAISVFRRHRTHETLAKMASEYRKRAELRSSRMKPKPIFNFQFSILNFSGTALQLPSPASAHAGRSKPKHTAGRQAWDYANGRSTHDQRALRQTRTVSCSRSCSANPSTRSRQAAHRNPSPLPVVPIDL